MKKTADYSNRAKLYRKETSEKLSCNDNTYNWNNSIVNFFSLIFLFNIENTLKHR